MSPGNQGVFQLLKEVTFRRILAFRNLWKRGNWRYYIILLCCPFAAVLHATLRPFPVCPRLRDLSLILPICIESTCKELSISLLPEVSLSPLAHLWSGRSGWPPHNTLLSLSHPQTWPPHRRRFYVRAQSAVPDRSGLGVCPSNWFERCFLPTLGFKFWFSEGKSYLRLKLCSCLSKILRALL